MGEEEEERRRQSRCVRIGIYVVSVLEIACTATMMGYYIYMYNFNYSPVAQIGTYNTEYTQMVISIVLFSLTLARLVVTVLRLDIFLNRTGTELRLAASTLKANQVEMTQLMLPPTDSSPEARDSEETVSCKLCCLSFQVGFQMYAIPLMCFAEFCFIILNLILINRLEFWIWIVEQILFPLQIAFICCLLRYKTHCDKLETISQWENEMPCGCFWMSRRWTRHSNHTKSFSYSPFVYDQRYWTGPIYWYMFFFFIMVIILCSQSFGTDGGFFSEAQINAMNSQVDSQLLYQNLNTTRLRIVLVLMDGLGYTVVTEQTDWVHLLNKSPYSNDIGLMTMQSQVPSVSIPNWISLMGSIPPWMSGTLGNIGEISFVFAMPLYNVGNYWGTSNLLNVFNETIQSYNSYNLNKFAVVSSWFYSLIERYVTPLQYGITMPNPNSPYLDELDSEEAEDVAHLHLVKQIIGSDNFELIQVYFNQPDPCGHHYGLGGSYDRCAGNMAQAFQSILDSVSQTSQWNNTIVIGFADHGHVQGGGHGGTRGSVRDTPLIVYQRNSNFQRFFNGTISNLLFAPTVSALLQIPVPRQALGTWIYQLEPLIISQSGTVQISVGNYIPYYLLAGFDVFQEARQLDQFFFRQCGLSLSALNSLESSNPELVMARGTEFPYGIPLDVVYLNELLADPNNPVLQQQIFQMLRANKDQLDQLFDDQKQTTWNSVLVRNYLTNTIIIVMALLCISNRAILFSIIDNPCRSGASKRQYSAFVEALIFIFVYHFICIVIPIAVQASLGYPVFDSSFLHHPIVILRFLLVMWVPGSGVVFIYVRATDWFWVESPSIRRFLENRDESKEVDETAYHCCGAFVYYIVQFFRWVFMDYPVYTNCVIDWGPIYLRRSWLLIMALVMMTISFLMEGAFFCVIPIFFSRNFIDATSWDFRFFFICYVFISIPLIVGSLILWCFMPYSLRDQRSESHCNVRIFDQEYRCKFAVSGSIDHKFHDN